MKLVVPVKPRSFEEATALDLSKYDGADIIEWRADFLPVDEILTVAPVIFEKFAGREVIFSLRTSEQGGQISLTSQAYVDLLKSIQTLYQPDYLDFEYYAHQEVFDQMTEYSNLILSYYNFERTPEQLMTMFSELTALSPRVIKFCVQPNNQQDVLDLMNFTRGFKTLNPNQDYVSIAMGEYGQVTRIFGQLFGSSWSSVKVDESLTSGQLSLLETKQILDILETNQ